MAVKITRKVKRKKVTRRKRLPSLRSLKNKLDKLFSEFIRRRGSVRGKNTCVSCGTVLPWQRLQCGHYHRRVHLETRWDEDNCWPQCMACNVWRRGNYASFARFMYSRYSMDEMDKLHAKAAQKIDPTRVYLLGKLERVVGLLSTVGVKGRVKLIAK
jgi:hypothetical protein